MASSVVFFLIPLVFMAFIIVASFAVSLVVSAVQIVRYCRGRTNGIRIPLCITGILGIGMLVLWGNADLLCMVSLIMTLILQGG